MKVTITYEYDPNHEPFHFAKATVNEEEILKAGHTWAQARHRLLEAVDANVNKHQPPPSEDVEIEVR